MPFLTVLAKLTNDPEPVNADAPDAFSLPVVTKLLVMVKFAEPGTMPVETAVRELVPDKADMPFKDNFPAAANVAD
jgi:hypothetical protein